MAGGVNKVILVGHLGADPELKYTPSGQAVCEFRIATTESWKDKGGQRQERTEWHRIVAWGKLAEVCGKYLAKGRQVYLEGKIQTRSWEKDGQKHWTTEVIASDVQFLGGGKNDGGGRGRGDDGPEPPDGDAGNGGGYSRGGGHDDDLPFARCDVGAEPSAIARALRGDP